MGRLENFIPSLKPHRIETSTGVSLIHFDGDEPFTIESELVPFLQQINGHLSLKEIYLYLNEKGVRFSLEKAVEILRHFANHEHITDPDSFFKALRGAGHRSSPGPQRKSFDRSYFSTERLVALIQKTTLFLRVERSTAETLINNAELIKLEEGDQVIAQGSKSPYFYILLTGEMGVFRDDELLASLGSLTVFGESAAVFNKERNAHVICTEPSWMLQIDASKIVDTQSPDSFEAFKGLKSRLILNQTLSANPLFASLPTDVLQLFISKCRLEKYGKEQVVLEQGEVSGDFYFILRGSVTIIKDGMPVTSLSEGNHFGEVAAIFNEPRTASVICEMASIFLVLNQKALNEVFANNFRLGIKIERTAKSRKKSTGNLLQIFEDNFETEATTDVITLDEVTRSIISDEQEFLDSTQTNFELTLVDFSKDDLSLQEE